MLCSQHAMQGSETLQQDAEAQSLDHSIFRGNLPWERLNCCCIKGLSMGSCILAAALTGSQGWEALWQFCWGCQINSLSRRLCILAGLPISMQGWEVRWQ